jgi:hypothetical protein
VSVWFYDGEECRAVPQHYPIETIRLSVSEAAAA